MPNPNDANNTNDYFPQPQPPEQSIEIPADQQPYDYNRVPSGNDPLGRIEQRGMAYSNLARGRAPWWILIAGWVVFGGLALGLLRMAIAGSIVSWLLLAIALLPLVILLQGTWAKASGNQRR
jgi:hypothetical protein